MQNEENWIQFIALERDKDQANTDIFRAGISKAYGELHNATEAWLDSIAIISITLGSALIAIGVSLSSDKKLHHPNLFWGGVISLILNGFIILIWKKIITELAGPKVALIGLEEQYKLAKSKQLANDIIDGTISGQEAYRKWLSAKISYIKTLRSGYTQPFKSLKLELRTDLALYLLFLGISCISLSAFKDIKWLIYLFILFSIIFLVYVGITIKLTYSSQSQKDKYENKIRKISASGLDKEIIKWESLLETLSQADNM